MASRSARRIALLAVTGGVLLLSGGCAPRPLDSFGDPGRVSVRVEVVRLDPVAAPHAHCSRVVG